MTSNGNAARLIAKLTEAGWTVGRQAGAHVLYRCPCGKHFATVGASKRRDSGSGPIDARIRQCRAAMAAAA